MPSRYITRDKEYSFDQFNFVGYKIKLYPTDEQIEEFEKYFGACRFIYNYCIDMQEKLYAEENKHYHYSDFSKEIISLRKRSGYEWLQYYNLESLRMTTRDVLRAYDLFISSHNSKPKYRTKKNYHQSFPLRSDRVTIFRDKVKIPSIGMVDIKEIYDNNIVGTCFKESASLPYVEYLNCRVVYDGIDYYLCFNIEKNDSIRESSYYKYNNDIYKEKISSNPVGIDVGCSKNNWVVVSDGSRYNLPDFSKEEKKLKLLNSKFSHKLKINDNERTNHYQRTNNEKKLIKKINKYHKKIIRRRLSKAYDIAHEIVSKKPEYIVTEDLNIKDLYVNGNSSWTANHIRSFNRNIQLHSPRVVIDTIEKVARTANVPIIKADREYHSTQICSNCKMINPNIGKSKVFICPHCGFVIDRDLNASINLKNYLNPIKPFVVGI